MVNADARDRGIQRRQSIEELCVAIYRLIGPARWSMVSAEELAEGTRWPVDRVLSVSQDAVKRGLVKYETMGPTMVLTAAGVDTVEAIMRKGGSASDREAVDRRQAARLEMLNFVYVATEGDERKAVNFREAADRVGISDEHELVEVAQWLVERGLLDWYALGGLIQLTQHGVDQVEQARQEPEESVEPGLPAMNVLVIQNSTGIVVQQGSPGALQISIGDFGSMAEIRGWLTEVRERLDDLELDAESRSEFEETLVVAEGQSKRQIASTVLRAALTDLRAFLIATGANVAAMLLAGSFPGHPG